MARTLAALAAMLMAAGTLKAENIVFPDDSGVVDVKAKYGAKGDGVTDDTAALQKAIDEVKGKPNTLYFPNGVYLVSDRLYEGGVPHSRDRFLVYQGQSEAGTIIRLKDSCPGYDDPAKPKVVLALYDGQSTGDTMHGYVRNLTVDVGKGNPGAVGLRFMANNTGAMYHVTIRSSDPKKAGKIGLDMRQSQNGPDLIKHVTVIGFDNGVETGNSFALVFEHLTLKGQNVLGFRNKSARTTIRDLVSVNSVPVLSNEKGGSYVTLIEGDFSGGSASNTAISSHEPKMFLRDIKQQGYGHIVQDSGGKCVDGASLNEWYEGKGQSLFGANPATLRLPIKETPEVPWETDLAKWVKVSPQGDCTKSLQDAIDDAAKTGKTTIYFPRGQGQFKMTGPIRVHGSVNRIIGLENLVDIVDPDGRLKAGGVVFTIDDLKSPVLVIERFFLLGGWNGPKSMHLFENKSGRTIVLQNVGHTGITKLPGTGEWFIEDVSPSRESTLKIGPGEKCWARQFDPETPEADMIDVNGGQLWILGLKTEGRATHIVARGGAKVELLGGVSYQSWGKQKLDPPMFKVIDSEASFTLGFYHYDTPFATIVEETLGGQTRTLARKDLLNYHLPVYRSGAARSGGNP